MEFGFLEIGARRGQTSHRGQTPVDDGRGGREGSYGTTPRCQVVENPNPRPILPVPAPPTSPCSSLEQLQALAGLASSHRQGLQSLANVLVPTDLQAKFAASNNALTTLVSSDRGSRRSAGPVRAMPCPAMDE